ncbi:MAG: T9SS type A sorting domain-containing protein [Saprospiraceae bacterium]|nr:T9SS type A sorting domain-containing protein [Saprospiraceae bacterium]
MNFITTAILLFVALTETISQNISKAKLESINFLTNELNIQCKLGTHTKAVLNMSDFEALLNCEKATVNVNKALHSNQSEKLVLYSKEFFEPNYKIWVDSSNGMNMIECNTGKHFTGIIENEPNSTITLSIYDNSCRGLIIHDNGEQSLISSTITESGIELNFTPAPIRQKELHCMTHDIEHFIEADNSLSLRTRESCNRVAISIRADYELYLRFNKNSQSVVTYVTSLFNQVHSIYRKEEIQISISEIIINTVADGFPHTSSNADLNYLKNKYKAFNGNISLVLSGFLRSGKASLGGVAYINSVCLKSFAFGFANIEISDNKNPNFNYDAFLVAHELGHVMGSRHTHACVWGPNKNQALDNCATVEGSCKPISSTFKGSIMSYCYLPGKPGIDFNTGFGQEPGDLIRKNIKASSCLTPYSPQLSTISNPATTIQANVECSDGQYSHYYFDNNTIDEKDDILIASIKKNTEDIGNIYDGSLQIKAHTTTLYGTSKAIELKVAYSQKNVIPANRYWEINSNKQITKPIHIKLNYSASDLKDIQFILPTISTEKLSFYTVKEPASANPDLKHSGITTMVYKEYKNSSIAGSSFWLNKKLNENIYSAEFQIESLNLDIGLSYNKSNSFNDLSSRTSSEIKIKSINNPISNDELLIFADFVSQPLQPVTIQLYDLAGKQMKTISIALQKSYNSIPVSDIMPGMYLIVIDSNGQRIFKQILTRL